MDAITSHEVNRIKSVQLRLLKCRSSHCTTDKNGVLITYLRYIEMRNAKVGLPSIYPSFRLSVLHTNPLKLAGIDFTLLDNPHVTSVYALQTKFQQK